MSNNKLQLLDYHKLTELFDIFDKERKEKKLLEGILEPKLSDLYRSHSEMVKKTKDNDLKEARTVDFLKKKKALQDTKKKIAAADNVEGGNEVDGGGGDAKAKRNAANQKQIRDFLKENRIRFASGIVNQH